MGSLLAQELVKVRSSTHPLFLCVAVFPALLLAVYCCCPLPVPLPPPPHRPLVSPPCR